MTEPSEPKRTATVPDAELVDRDDGSESVRQLLRGALSDPDEIPDLTRGVQKKIRVRSGGKFYTDGWSTAKHPPINTFLVTSLLMLFVVGVIYALLAPLSGAPEPAPPPKPVQVLPP